MLGTKNRLGPLTGKYGAYYYAIDWVLESRGEANTTGFIVQYIKFSASFTWDGKQYDEKFLPAFTVTNKLTEGPGKKHFRMWYAEAWHVTNGKVDAKDRGMLPADKIEIFRNDGVEKIQQVTADDHFALWAWGRDGDGKMVNKGSGISGELHIVAQAVFYCGVKEKELRDLGFEYASSTARVPF